VFPVFVCTHCRSEGFDFKLQLVQTQGLTEKVNRQVCLCVCDREGTRQMSEDSPRRIDSGGVLAKKTKGGTSLSVELNLRHSRQKVNIFMGKNDKENMKSNKHNVRAKGWYLSVRVALGCNDSLLTVSELSNCTPY